MAMYMAIPNSDFDKISWIKASNIKQVAKKIQVELDLTNEDMIAFEYRVFEIPSSNKFNKMNTDIISRVETYTDMFMFDD